jgi:hypothetical protein
MPDRLAESAVDLDDVAPRRGRVSYPPKYGASRLRRPAPMGELVTHVGTK